MENDAYYTALNQALISAGMDPAKAMKHPTLLPEFVALCEEIGVKPSAIIEAAGV